MPDQPIKVLLVEDDQDDYVIMLDYFFRMKEDRYELEWICSYEEAQTEVARHRHDAYLFDYRLGMDSGLDLLREAKAGGCTAPIIMLTRHNDPEVEFLARQAGAAEFLHKNLTDAALLEKVLLKVLNRPPKTQTSPVP